MARKNDGACANPKQIRAAAGDHVHSYSNAIPWLAA
jgi:hypothetical protein